MPYKFEYDNTPLPEGKDRRVKLTDKDKQRVLELREQGYSQRELAREFDVSRRLIQFILDPAKKQRDLQRRKERGGWKQYYDKEKNTEYIRNHRRYKHKILKEEEDIGK